MANYLEKKEKITDQGLISPKGRTFSSLQLTPTLLSLLKGGKNKTKQKTLMKVTVQEHCLI